MTTKRNLFILLGLFLLLSAISLMMHPVLARKFEQDQLARTAPWNMTEYLTQRTPYYTNTSIDAVSNEVLNMALTAFTNRHAPHVHDSTPWGLFQEPMYIPVLSPADKILQYEFIDTLITGWENDSLSQFMPFNSAYLRHVLGSISIFFAPYLDPPRPRNPGPTVGFYQMDRFRGVNHMYITMWEGEREEGSLTTPRLMLHEVGRAFGLNDSLTVLFSEEFTASLDFNPTFYHSWDYSSAFDRALLNLVEPATFWHAAFTSNEAYGFLWDKHLGHIISFERLMFARSVMHEIQEYRNLELLEDFQNQSAVMNTWASLILIPSRFMEYTHDLDNIPEWHLNQILSVIDALADFAVENSILPFESVQNHTIYSAPLTSRLWIVWLYISCIAILLFLLLIKLLLQTAFAKLWKGNTPCPTMANNTGT